MKNPKVFTIEITMPEEIFDSTWKKFISATKSFGVEIKKTDKISIDGEEMNGIMGVRKTGEVLSTIIAAAVSCETAKAFHCLKKQNHDKRANAKEVE